MKRILSAFLFVFFCSLGYSQDSVSVSIMPQWVKCDVFKFNIKKIKTHEKDDGKKKKDSAVFTGTLTVLEVLDDKIKIAYKTNYNAMSQYGLGNEYFKSIDLNKKLELIYTTDAAGTFVGIENWTEIDRELTHSFNILLGIFKKEKAYSPADIENFENIFSFMKSRNFVEKNIYSELQLIHFLMGAELKDQQEIRYEDAVANQFGGDPLRSDATVKVKSINAERSEIRVIQEKTLSKEDVNKFMQSFFKKMKIKDEDLTKALKTSKFEISDHSEFVINYKTGIPEKIVYRRISDVHLASGDGIRVDEILIDRVP